MDLSPRSTDLSDSINALIDKALEAEDRAQPKRTYLGASIVGDPCERKLGYIWHGHEGEPFAGKTLRRFRLGHIHEDETAAWLRKAGFDLRTASESTGKQFSFALAPREDGTPRFAGNLDGIIMGGTDIDSIGLWEHKIMKSSIWTACKREGVEKNTPTYYAQMQVYMRQFGLSWGLFTALNSDTSELYFERVAYDSAKAEAIIDKAARIIESKAPEELPRVAGVETDFRCKFCAFRRQCWERGAIVVDTPARPAWLAR